MKIIIKKERKKGLIVEIDGNFNFEKAFRRFKKKVQESGLIEELRERMEYEKPSIVRKKAKNRAKKRWQKKLEASKLPEKLY